MPAADLLTQIFLTPMRDSEPRWDGARGSYSCTDGAVLRVTGGPGQHACQVDAAPGRYECRILDCFCGRS